MNITIGQNRALWYVVRDHYSCSCSVTQSCLTLSDPADCNMTAFPVLHHLLEFAQTHVHWAGDAIQPSHPLSPLLLLPSIFPSIRVFSSELVPCIRWPMCWSFSFSISPFNEYSGLISFRIDWLDLEPRVQGLANSKDNQYLLNSIFNWAPSALTTGKKAGAVVELILPWLEVPSICESGIHFRWYLGTSSSGLRIQP